jgi:Flp pilus assembly protein TadD
MGGHVDEAIQELNKGIELQPESANAHNGLGVELARARRLDEAATHMEKAVSLAPNSADFRYNFGRVLATKGDYPAAVVQFEAAAKLSGMQSPAILEMLAAAYSDTGRYSEAVQTARLALDLANQQQNPALAERLRVSLARYEGLAGSAQDPAATH